MPKVDLPEVEAMKTVFEAFESLPDEETRNRVLTWLLQKLKKPLPGTPPAGAQVPPGAAEPAGSNGLTPKAFMEAKQPQSDLERVTCLAFFLTQNRQIDEFKSKEIVALNTEARQPKISNVPQALGNAVKAKLLAPAGGGKRCLTSRGEHLVNALPDRAKVNALPKAPGKRGRKPKRKAKSA